MDPVGLISLGLLVLITGGVVVRQEGWHTIASSANNEGKVTDKIQARGFGLLKPQEKRVLTFGKDGWYVSNYSPGRSR